MTQLGQRSKSVYEITSISQSRPPTETLDQQRDSVPHQFKQFDFKNRSYGRYRFSWGKPIDLKLRDGRYEYDFHLEHGWFDLGKKSEGLYFTDLTNDKHPEALIILSHVSCGVSCDGGAALIYVYMSKANRMEEIWKWETGTMAYGCGLRSITVKNGKISLELFGRCSGTKPENTGSGKFKVADTTQLTFRFNGKRFVRSAVRFISVPEREVKNYKTEVAIE